MAIERNDIADLDLGEDGLAEHVEAFRGGRIVVGLERANPDTVRAGRRDKASDIGDVLAIQWRDKPIAIDLGNCDCSDGCGSSQRRANKVTKGGCLHCDVNSE